MKYKNNFYMQKRAERKRIRRKGFSIASFIFAGFFLLPVIFGTALLADMISVVFIFAGIGMLFEQGARNASAEARRYAEFNPTAYPAEMQAQMPHMQYYGNSSREYRRYLRNLRRYGMPNNTNPQQPNQTYNRQQTQRAAQQQAINQQKPVQAPVQPKQPTRALNEYFDQNLSLLDQGRAYAWEINKANELIPDEVISQNLNVICEHVNDIFIQASKSVVTERQIRKFGNIYLPQTLKLCNLYIDLQSKRVETKTVKEMKEQIAKSIANARCAFANFNENLMQQASIDIEAEVKTFENILTIDGLLGRHELVMPEVQKEKENA